jgi:PAS domain-containing protein
MTIREKLMERSPVPLAELEGPHHIMRYVNPAFCRLLGKSKAALIGKQLEIGTGRGDHA